MTSRKSAADNEGWRKGQGAYSKEVKLNRGSFPNSIPGTDPKGHGKYTTDDSGLTLKKVDPERLTNEAGRDIMDNVEANQLGGKTGPVKYGVD